jgi:hypothetical protein
VFPNNALSDVAASVNYPDCHLRLL